MTEAASCGMVLLRLMLRKEGVRFKIHHHYLHTKGTTL
jgi:hypothetical protein